MPILKSAAKRMKQNVVRRQRRLPFKTHMKTMVRAVRDLAKEGKHAEAQALLPRAYKSIDTAAKKRIIHSNTADRKKALIARLAQPAK